MFLYAEISFTRTQNPRSCATVNNWTRAHASLRSSFKRDQAIKSRHDALPSVANEPNYPELHLQLALANWKPLVLEALGEACDALIHTSANTLLQTNESRVLLFYTNTDGKDVSEVGGMGRKRKSKETQTTALNQTWIRDFNGFNLFMSQSRSLPDFCGWRWPRLALTGAAVGSGTSLPPP